MTPQTVNVVKNIEDSLQECIDHLREIKMHVEEGESAKACLVASYLRRSNNRVHCWIEELIEETLPFRP